MSRQDRWRVVGAVGGSIVLYVALLLFDFDPDPLRLLLLVLVCLATAALFVDVFGGDEALWDVVSARQITPSGQDHGYSSYVRVIESHLTVDVPDGALRDRLAAVADRRLEQRHGLRLGDPRADELLGPELTALILEPPRRMRRAEIDTFVARIEEL